MLSESTVAVKITSQLLAVLELTDTSLPPILTILISLLSDFKPEAPGTEFSYDFGVFIETNVT